MANPEHLAILEQDLGAWKVWRKNHPNVIPDLSGADLRGANLTGASLDVADLSEAVLCGAILSGADLVGATLVEADLSRAELWEANLGGADFSRADLVSSDFNSANLSSANLSAVDLARANLSRTNLVGAMLSGASLFRANLSGADLVGADLVGANLNAAFLSRANFERATVGGTILTDVDLSEVRGLEAVTHRGPSSIGVDTIYESKGRIPHVFLRGCGVPDNLIEYMASLVASGIEFYSLFISYSAKDQNFAERLHADLQAKGVRCWFAPHDIRSGEKIHEQIDAAIRVYDKLLLILSEHSMKSEWVKTEISKARKREVNEGRRILFPIRLCSFDELRDWECFDADTGKDTAREIREYFIPDFSNWKDHDSYKEAFDRLLKDLRGKPQSASS